MKLTDNGILMLGLCNTAFMGRNFGCITTRLMHGIGNPIGGTILLVLQLALLVWQIRILYNNNKNEEQ